MICCRALHIQSNQPGSSPVCWGHTGGSINNSLSKQFTSLQRSIVFLLEMGSFTNLVICIYVLKLERLKLSHIFEIDCLLTCNNHFCFSLKGSR